MQQQMTRQDNSDQELDEMKAQLVVAERDRNRAFEELREIKLRLSRISEENYAEINSTKECLQDANRELQNKEKTIQSLQSEVSKVKQLEAKLAEKDAALEAIKEQLSLSKATASETDGLLSDLKKKVEELEGEVSRRKESEAKLFNSFVNQTKQLQEASSILEEQRVEAIALKEKVQEIEENMREKEEAAREEVERLKAEVIVERQNSARAKDGDKTATIETKSLVNEIDFLKKELKKAMGAEETREKAMEDLALALKEVAAESNQAKEKLVLTEHQLEAVKDEAANLKKMVACAEGTYEVALNETKKENDKLTNIVNRLRLEAEESLMAWNEKEVEFVKCIKKADDEKSAVEAENVQLKQTMKEAAGYTEKSKEEIKKLRDILKQALSEANAAKEAASLARDENSYLKDSLSEKDKALLTLAQETERLRINEAEAIESIKELKRVLTSGHKKKALKLEDECSKEPKKSSKKDPAVEPTEKEPRERKLSNTFSFDLNQLWPSIPGISTRSSKDTEDIPHTDDALGGTIFDLVESPEREHPTYHRRTSSACSSSDEAILNFDSFDEYDDHYDDMEIERGSHGKRKALLRRFGDLLRRKNTHPHHPPKDLPHPPHPPKEVTHPPKEIAA